MRSSWPVLAILALALAPCLVWLQSRGPLATDAPQPSAQEHGAEGSESGAAWTDSPAFDAAQRSARDVGMDLRGPLILDGVPGDFEVQYEGEQPGTLTVVAVSEEDGAPVPGVRVMLTRAIHPQSLERETELLDHMGWKVAADTDSSGRARLIAFAQEARLWVRGATPIASFPIEPLEPRERREIHLRLPTRADLRFVARVVDDESGSPVPAAWAAIGDLTDLLLDPYALGRLLAQGIGELGSEPLRIHPDPDGYLVLDVCSWKRRVALVAAPGYAPALVHFVPGHASRATARGVRLMRSAALDVLALDAERQPLVDVGITVSTPAWDFLRVPTGLQVLRWDGLTGNDGRARIDPLPPGVLLSVSGARFRFGELSRVLPEPVALRPGETRSLDISFAPGATLVGWLCKPDGRPESTSSVWMKPKTEHGNAHFTDAESRDVRKASTDERGRFSFERVPDGTWIVGVAPTGALAHSTDQVQVNAGIPAREAHLTAWSDLSIRGTVLDPLGRPCAEVRIVAQSKSGAALESTRTGTDGQFLLGPLAPETYELSARPLNATENLLASCSPRSAEAGASNVVVELCQGGAIGGRIVDAATGQATPGVVLLCPSGVDATREISWLTSSFASFGVAPGSYRLAASTRTGSWGVLSDVAVAAGERVDSLEIAVSPGGNLRVRYDGATPRAEIRVLHRGIQVVTGTVAQGMFESWSVPLGELQVICSETSDTGPRTRDEVVSVTAGALAEVRF